MDGLTLESFVLNQLDSGILAQLESDASDKIWLAKRLDPGCGISWTLLRFYDCYSNSRDTNYLFSSFSVIRLRQMLQVFSPTPPTASKEKHFSLLLIHGK